MPVPGDEGLRTAGLVGTDWATVVLEQAARSRQKQIRVQIITVTNQSVDWKAPHYRLSYAAHLVLL